MYVSMLKLILKIQIILEFFLCYDLGMILNANQFETKGERKFSSKKNSLAEKE